MNTKIEVGVNALRKGQEEGQEVMGKAAQELHSTLQGVIIGARAKFDELNSIQECIVRDAQIKLPELDLRKGICS